MMGCSKMQDMVHFGHEGNATIYDEVMELPISRGE